MPIKILDKKKCTGCGMCSNICPKKCITMKVDIAGFLYPDVNLSACINCGQCFSNCPMIYSTKLNHGTPIVYAAKSRDESNRFESTSGGIFTELAMEIIRRSGYVVGAKYNEEHLVEHCMIENMDGLKLIRQSKYIQSDTKGIYLHVLEALKKNIPVLFCGTPCQIAALYSFLGKSYGHLITVDFICRGVNSQKAFKYWIKEIEEINKCKAEKIWFKYKVNGWRRSPKCTRVDFTNGKYQVYSDDDNLFMLGYLKENLYIRPSCGECHFKGESRMSDITLADFWGLNNEFDDDKGVSMVLLNSEKGKSFFTDIDSHIYAVQRTAEEIRSGNIYGTTSVEINPNSDRFLRELENHSFSELIKPYLREPLLKSIKRTVKHILSMNRK